MAKEPSWRARAIYIVFALALVFGLSAAVLTPQPASAENGTLDKTITLADGTVVDCDHPMSGIVQITYTYIKAVTPDILIDRLELQITGPDPYGAHGAGVPIPVIFDRDGWAADAEEQMLAMGVVDVNGDGSLDLDTDLIFTEDTGPPYVATFTFWVDTTKNWEVYPPDIGLPWDRPVHTSVWPMGPCTEWHELGKYRFDAWVYDEDNVDIAHDLDNWQPLYNEPYIEPDIGYDLKGHYQRFVVKGAGPVNIVEPWTVLPGINSPAIHVKGGGIGEDWIDVMAIIQSDAIVWAYVDTDQDGEWDVKLEGEKKWGEVCKTFLTASETTDIEVCDTVYVYELVEGSFLPAPPAQRPAGGARVSWWLLADTEENQEQLRDLIKGFANYELYDTEGWGCGRYGDWAIPPDPTFVPRDLLWDIYNKPGDDGVAKFTDFVDLEGVVIADETYVETKTDDNWGPLPEGETYVSIHFDDADPTADVEAEAVIVVVLAEYQIDKHGENPVCVEFIKLSPKPPVPVYPPTQVKIPQVRWAGEKICLCKHWGPDFADRVVTWQLEHPGLGTLESMLFGITIGELVYSQVDAYGDACSILNSEEPGQANVKLVLYDVKWEDVFGDLEAGIIPHMSPIAQHAFPVFFLKLESIEPLVAEPDPIVIPDGEDATLGWQVKGWFTSANASDRPELCKDFDLSFDSDGDGDPTNDYICLPAGRWVLPDDWPLLAGADWATLRPHWNLMDNPTDAIVSANPLGPFDGGVNTVPGVTTPDLSAEYPVVGPFQTIQPTALINNIPVWVTTRSGWLDLPTRIALNVPGRTTVVPNFDLEWWDAPMPPAKIIFRADSDLSQAMKWNTPPYVAAGIFTAPFYASEIPACSWIPPMGYPEGYSWDSWNWGTGDPIGIYWFWRDLGIFADDLVLEVYSDNNGRAFVTIDGRPAGSATTITATADYPYLRKHPAMRSDEVTQEWVPEKPPPPETIHIDADPFLFAYPGATCDLPDALTNIGPDGLDLVITVWGTVAGEWVSFDAATGAGFLRELVTGLPYVMTHVDGVCNDWEMPE